MKNTFLAACLGVTLSAAGAAWAHGDLHGRKPQDKPWLNAEQKPYGNAGDPGKVTRTIKMDMSDSMHYSPDVIKLKPGETIRFVVKNSGKLMHEIVLGTMPILKEHAS
jgi:plastocyanin